MKSINQHINKLREDFLKGELSEENISHEPNVLFEHWFNEAINLEVNEPLAFNLATVNEENKPTSRIVYLREFGENKFYFFTNYHSRKAQELVKHPHICMNFFWPELERQVRIEGTVEKASKEKSDSYFEHRPKESKIGAWSSPQSKVIVNRNELENLVNENRLKFTTDEIPRPEFWGGFVITAHYYEFWQGRKSRLHDRISFTQEGDNWKINRLAP